VPVKLFQYVSLGEEVSGPYDLTESRRGSAAEVEISPSLIFRAWMVIEISPPLPRILYFVYSPEPEGGGTLNVESEVRSALSIEIKPPYEKGRRALVAMGRLKITANATASSPRFNKYVYVTLEDIKVIPGLGLLAPPPKPSVWLTKLPPEMREKFEEIAQLEVV